MQSYKLHLKVMETSKGPHLRVSHTIKENPVEDGVQWIKPPYRPGEKCYVREAWCLYQTLNLRKMPDGRSFDEISDGLYGYKADGFDTIQDFKDHIRLISDSSFLDIFVKDDRWQSPAVMPQIAARRFVTILSCEPVRVRDISEEDARASGVTDGGCLNCGEHEPCGCDDPQPSPRETFLYDWHKRHPGKEWAWRVESEEEK
jgi:hypothetical protein